MALMCLSAAIYASAGATTDEAANNESIAKPVFYDINGAVSAVVFPASAAPPGAADYAIEVIDADGIST